MQEPCTARAVYKIIMRKVEEKCEKRNVFKRVNIFKLTTQKWLEKEKFQIQEPATENARSPYMIITKWL